MNETMGALPLNALRALALVHEHRGVRAAARELGISHSSLSRHLSELETWLGVRLTEDPGGRRGLTFTPQGEALGQGAFAALRDLERVALSVREARSARSVVVSTTGSFSARWLLPRLARLEAERTDLEVSVWVDTKPVDLEGGEVDLAIRMGRGPWRDLDCEPLLDEVLYPVMSPAYHRKAGSPRRPAALGRLRLLHDRDPSATWESWRRTFGPAALEVRRGPRFASSDLVLRAAALGHGVALARHRLAADDVAAGALLRPFESASLPLGPAYWLVLPARGAVLSAATRAFAAWVRAAARADAL